jgi:hypothetical protein
MFRRTVIIIEVHTNESRNSLYLSIFLALRTCSPLAILRDVFEQVQSLRIALFIVFMNNLQVRFAVMSHELKFEL